MSTESSPEAVLRDRLVPQLAALLDDGPLPTDPDELERLAAMLLVPLEQPGMHGDAPQALLDVIEQHGDADAVGILAAIGAIGREPISGQARAAVDRLAGAGVTCANADLLGALGLREGMRMEDGDAELLVALLRRPRARKAQVAVLGIEREATGGALVECMLTPPLSAAETRELLDGEALETGASAPERVSPAELTRRAAAAAQRAVDVGVPLGHDGATVMPIIARALTGDPAGLARPESLPPWEDDDPELIVDAANDEDGYHRVMERLLDELEEYATAAYAAGSAVRRHGAFVASSMLEWKGGYGDGVLGRWTADDLAEYLLDHFPRKVSVADEGLEAVPECAIAFLRFLDDRGSLSGEPPEHLEEACEALRDEFRRRAQDSGSWGLAKSMVMQMYAEGVDPGDSQAVEAWMAEFNARSRAERDEVIGGAADRMLAAARPSPGGRAGGDRQRRAQRKAQRTARKRNRRRR